MFEEVEGTNTFNNYLLRIQNLVFQKFIWVPNTVYKDSESFPNIWDDQFSMKLNIEKFNK